ncbi:MAG: hypothetical protein LKE29_08815 [Acidaminococcaceae bacterium]|jgi:predicted permease|nr:hypothetical protein [Acidaminococcaceae bacterium]
MAAMLVKSLIFLGIIFLAFAAKRLGICGNKTRLWVSKIIFMFTLPATIITGFASFHPRAAFFSMCLLGFLCDCLLLAIGLFLSRGEQRSRKIMYGLTLSGYNIGCFALPMAQMILGPEGIVATCMFDLGNSLMCAGGTYTFLNSYLAEKNRGEKPTLWGNLKTLLCSWPFDTYLIMLIIALLNIKLPPQLLAVTRPISQVNAYISMFMLGLFMEFKTSHGGFGLVAKTLLARYGANFCLAVLFLFILPFSSVMHKVLFITTLAPVSALSAIFVEKLQGDWETTGLAASVSIVVSMILLPIIMVIL